MTLEAKPPFRRRSSWILYTLMLLQAYSTAQSTTASQTTTTTATANYYYSWQSTPAEGFTVYIRKTSTVGMVDITLITTTHAMGWVGFGFGSSMENADIMMCWSNADGSRAIVSHKLGYSGGVGPVQQSLLTPNLADSRIVSTPLQNGGRSTYLSCRFTRPIPHPYPRSFIWASSSNRPISESAIGMHELNGVFASEFLSPASLNALSLLPEPNATVPRAAAPIPKSASAGTANIRQRKNTTQEDTESSSSMTTRPMISHYLSVIYMFMIFNIFI